MFRKLILKLFSLGKREKVEPTISELVERLSSFVEKCDQNDGESGQQGSTSFHNWLSSINRA